MLDFLREWLGLHVCEEFTQWETKEVPIIRAVGPWAADDGYRRAGLTQVTTGVKRWQERVCTMCGKIQQRKVKYPA